MTEKEKNEVCKGYADLIIRKEQLIREIWKTEFGIKNLEDVLKRNKILVPTPPEETIGGRSRNLVKLIGADNVSRRNFKYEGTCYITEDGELYNKEYVIAQKPQRTGVSFYEVSNWIYNERKQLYEPIIRRIVMIKKTNTQLSLNYE